ncbi:MAG: DNA repair protein RecN [Candidatus Nanopelagicaceae bacterium]
MGSRSRQLHELSIRNLGVIEEASLSFGPGFNVITGETGAGKTMVLTGLNLIAGGRSDIDLVRRGSERLSASLIISLDQAISGDLGNLINEHSPEIDENSLILQRSVSSDGRSKAVIGSNPATLSLLQRFADELFVIHGQSTNHKLVDEDYQLSLLDRREIECQEALRKYQSSLQSFTERNRELSELKKALESREREITNTERFIQDLERVRPLQDEWLEGEARISRLDSVEELRTALDQALAALTDESQGVIANFYVAIKSLDHLSLKDQSFADAISRLRSAHLEVNEVVRDLRRESDGLEAEPGELDRLRERRSILKQYLQRNRHEVPADLSESEALDALIELLPKKKALLEDLQQSDTKVAELIALVESERSELQNRAQELTSVRKRASERLAASVNAELKNLGLIRAVFTGAFQSDYENTLGRNGADRVHFLFSAHEGEKPLPLNKGASGGELSRVMLAIELALSDHREIGTLIFDEIDAGIGGETGLIIGERLSRLAKHFQVIVITHLAQVASWADRHFRIEKNESDEIVLSSVVEVSGEERVREIARMLSGQSQSAVALDHARDLLEHAQKS